MVSVRNLGDSRHAGEFVKRHFSDIGSAGGHRAMAKAVTPVRHFLKKFGLLDAEEILATTRELATQFLGEAETARRQRTNGPQP